MQMPIAVKAYNQFSRDAIEAMWAHFLFRKRKDNSFRPNQYQKNSRAYKSLIEHMRKRGVDPRQIAMMRNYKAARVVRVEEIRRAVLGKPIPSKVQESGAIYQYLSEALKDTPDEEKTTPITKVKTRLVKIKMPGTVVDDLEGLPLKQAQEIRKREDGKWLVYWR